MPLVLRPSKAPFPTRPPPRPDIQCQIAGSPYLFELGEITDECLAKNFSRSLRTGEISGGAFSQEGPFIRMFRKKATRSYETNGAPVDLVLYYESNIPTIQPFGTIWRNT